MRANQTMMTLLYPLVLHLKTLRMLLSPALKTPTTIFQCQKALRRLRPRRLCPKVGFPLNLFQWASRMERNSPRSPLLSHNTYRCPHIYRLRRPACPWLCIPATPRHSPKACSPIPNKWLVQGEVRGHLVIGNIWRPLEPYKTLCPTFPM